MLQTLLVVLIVAGAALYVGSRGWRTLRSARRRSEPGCGGDCGCGH